MAQLFQRGELFVGDQARVRINLAVIAWQCHRVDITTDRVVSTPFSSHDRG